MRYYITITAACDRHPSLSSHTISAECNIEEGKICFPDSVRRPGYMHLSENRGIGEHSCELMGVCYDIFLDIKKLLDSLTEAEVKERAEYAKKDGCTNLPLNLHSYISSDPAFGAAVFLEYKDEEDDEEEEENDVD